MTARLRDAAKALRERAEAASSVTLEAAWGHDGKQVTAGDGQWMVVAETAETNECPALAAYIATMHPLVGLAIADWLDFIAKDWETGYVSVSMFDAARISNLILGTES